MIRSRLRTSIYPPLTGENRLIKLEGKLNLLERCNVRIGNSIDLFSVRNLLCSRTLSNFITKGVGNPEQSPDSSSDEDDFSELGPPVGQGIDTFPISMTEKPQHFRKIDRARHALSGSSLHEIGSLRSINEALELHNSSSDLHFGLENHKHSSSNGKADKFLDLGSSLPQGIGPTLKLRTEKPDRFMKTKSTRNASAVSLPKSRPQLKDEALRLGNSSSPPHLKLENHNGGPRSNIGNKQESNVRNLNSVTVQKIPSTINPPQLKEAMSIFGKISNATMRTVESGLNCCDVEFESVESSRKALSAGQIMVNNFSIPISPLHALEAVTIRISNLNARTDDSMIHSVCMSYGNLDTLVRTKDDAVDAVFLVKDKYGLLAMLKKLNNTMMDDCQWSACIQPPGSPSAVVANENVSQQQLGLQVHRHMLVLLGQLSENIIYMEDLENLHCALMHLDSHPMNSGTKGVNESQKKCQNDVYVESM
ncbi:uncharacterized protein LOC120007754 isoform X2 [Tripterygium wilfordii]|uniref:uncharacterized protein LOC120007754 isoform X2 n=1 Tax=Tripterygium wilfordii TaxID=458696 RepID=UPI0018F81A57|nr:uncharacterized protein LOC120007754 isoform X2 [Tripterygium wilfordii]